MKSWDDMRHDEALVEENFPPPEGDDPYPPMPRWERMQHWIMFYWPPTRGWTQRIWLWWGYHVHRYPKPPPLDQDPIYQRLFGEGRDRSES